MKKYVLCILIAFGYVYGMNDPFKRSNIFYDERNVFYSINMQFAFSQYKEVILQYEDLLKKIERGEISATKNQILLAKNALGQAYRAEGNLEKGYTYIVEAMNSGLKRPLTQEVLKQLAENNDVSKTIVVRGADSSRRFGIGDMLGDGPYIRELTRRGVAKIIEIVSPSVKELHKKAACADVVLSTEDPEPVYDYETMLFALPHFLGVKTTFDIPQQPYLDIDKKRYDYWYKRIAQESGTKIPVIVWHLTSNFPVPEGRKLSQRKVSLEKIASGLFKRNIKLITVAYGHPPITQQELEKMDPEKQREYSLDVVSEQQKSQITHLTDISLEDIFALVQVVVDQQGFACGSDTAIPSGLAYTIQDPNEKRRICMLLPYHSDARWGNRPSNAKGRDGRLPNIKEFWQREEGDWSHPIEQVGEYIMKQQ